MEALNDSEVRTLLLGVALLLLAGLLLASAVELSREQKRVETTVTKLDAAAWEVAQVLEEAREITRKAAEERE